MPLTAEQRTARARLAAHRRHHGSDADVPDDAAELERAALDRHIAELVAAAPRMTPEQRDRLSRLYKYGPAEGGASGDPKERGPQAATPRGPRSRTSSATRPIAWYPGWLTW